MKSTITDAFRMKIISNVVAATASPNFPSLLASNDMIGNLSFGGTKVTVDILVETLVLYFRRLPQRTRNILTILYWRANITPLRAVDWRFLLATTKETQHDGEDGVIPSLQTRISQVPNFYAPFPLQDTSWLPSVRCYCHNQLL